MPATIFAEGLCVGVEACLQHSAKQADNSAFAFTPCLHCPKGEPEVRA